MSADLEYVFNPEDHNPTMGGGQSLPVSGPDGWLVTIIESDMKQTQDGTSMMLALLCKIVEGPQAGVEGYWNLNLGHANPVTVRIAQQALSCICHAVGHLGPIQNTEPLHNKPFRVVVAAQIDKATGLPDERGYVDIKKVLRADGSKLSDPAGSAGAAPAPAPAPALAQTAPAPAPAQATAQAAPAPAQPAITNEVPLPTAPAAPPAAPAQTTPAPAAPVTPPNQAASWPAEAAPAPAAPTAPPAQAAPAPTTAPQGQPWAKQNQQPPQ